MGKQIFNNVGKRLTVLIVVFCVIAITAVAVHAKTESKYGEYTPHVNLPKEKVDTQKRQDFDIPSKPAKVPIIDKEISKEGIKINDKNSVSGSKEGDSYVGTYTHRF